MNAGKFFLGIGAGLSAGYLAVRAYEARKEWREPSPALPRDAVAYGRLRRRLELAETVRGTLAAFAFAQGALGASIDRATRAAPVWSRPAISTAAISLVSSAIGLPAAFVEDYTLERRYGLSDQTRSAWLGDYTKSAAVSTLLTALLSTLFGAAVRRAPRSWPWLAAAGTLPLFVLGNIVVPLFVLPLFNTFEPLTGPLEVRLRSLAGRYGVGDAEILRMDMSRQTRKANAFVTGIGSTHRIVLGDTLLASFDEDEIVFVVAHELGHYVAKDTWRLIGLGEALALVLFLAAHRSMPGAQAGEVREGPLLLAQLYARMLLLTQMLRPLLFAFTRSREWAADRFALAATQDPSAGSAAFRRLRDQNLADEDPPGWYELLFSSHPSLKKRIAVLEAGG